MSDDRGVVRLGLRNQHPVEGIVVMLRQLGEVIRVGERDGELVALAEGVEECWSTW